MEEQKTHQEAQSAEKTATPNSAPAQSAAVKDDSEGSMPIIATAVVIALLAGGAFYYFMYAAGDDTSTSVSNDLFSSTDTGASVTLNPEDYPEVVAVVNGEPVSRETFIESFTRAQQSYVQQGANLSDAETRSQVENEVLETIINNTLVLQAAAASGVTVDDERVESEIARIAGQFPDEATFAAAVAEQGLTEASLRENLREQLVVDQYLTDQPEIAEPTVTEAEVQESYEQIAAGQDGVPPLEEVYTALEQQMVIQKQQTLIQELVAELRADADVEISL